MRLPISGTQFGFDGLDCPSCNGNYLHHCGITYYNRSEDGDRGEIVTLDSRGGEFRNEHRTNAAMNDCPSPRRDGFIVYFSCECCPTKSELAIFQHKGQTFIEWINAKEDKPQRKSIKPSLRFEIMKRDNYRCQMCGISAKDGATLEIDHITPVAKGGSNDTDNLQVLCRDCNAGKSDQWQ